MLSFIVVVIQVIELVILCYYYCYYHYDIGLYQPLGMTEDT